MPAFLIVILVLAAAFVLLAAVVQVRARRSEKQAIAQGDDITGPDAPDPVAQHESSPVWAQFHERSQWPRL